jgi:exopolysaccharide/PEP-CTERM locus tyrosine autokinase
VSLVESAIAKLKRAGGEAAPEADAAGMGQAPGLSAATSSEIAPVASGRTDRQVVININALRAAGYLPEASKDRQFAEHFRRIKRPIIDKAMSGDRPPGDSRNRRLVMVTSALPGDGKTFTTLNLALSIARERDVSVLLVDADGLKQHVSSIFAMRDEPGLLDALMDVGVDVNSLVMATNLRGLSFLPAGRLSEGTAELLSSNRMKDIVARLSNENPRRIVLMDSPPLLITNEGRILLKLAGQVALVVRAGKTPEQAVRDAIAMLEPGQSGGVILNEGRVGLTEGYYGYGEYGGGDIVDGNKN